MTASFVIDFKTRTSRGLNAFRRGAGAIFLGLALAACTTGSLNPIGTGTSQTATPAAPSGDLIGAGGVKVALLLPASAGGNIGSIAGPLRNAAQLAVQDFQTANIQLIVKDTQGTPAGATAAAEAAVTEGAELIVGPLLGSSVSAVAPVARAANVPVIAFSTDTTVAGPGVYLLSFLPQNDIRRIVSYASSQGRTTMAALLPDNGYGVVVGNAVSEAAAARGVNVTSVERYPANAAGMATPAQGTAATVRAGATAVVLPDGAGALGTLGPLLQRNGVDPLQTKILGSGQWDNPTSQRIPFLAGGWYAAPNPAGWTNFRSRYSSTFGGQPPRIATIPYDAVSLAAALSRGRPGQRYTTSVLTNPSGFAGVDGIFRFTRDGLNQRGLAVLEVTPGGGARVIDPAPTRFAGAGF
ncbi:MAG: penicillin-binding protein activator [Pseudomonadota bacterium]